MNFNRRLSLISIRTCPIDSVFSLLVSQLINELFSDLSEMILLSFCSTCSNSFLLDGERNKSRPRKSPSHLKWNEESVTEIEFTFSTSVDVHRIFSFNFFITRTTTSFIQFIVKTTTKTTNDANKEHFKQSEKKKHARHQAFRLMISNDRCETRKATVTV